MQAPARLVPRSPRYEVAGVCLNSLAPWYGKSPTERPTAAASLPAPGALAKLKDPGSESPIGYRQHFGSSQETLVVASEDEPCSVGRGAGSEVAVHAAAQILGLAVAGVHLERVEWECVVAVAKARRAGGSSGSSSSRGATIVGSRSG